MRQSQSILAKITCETKDKYGLDLPLFRYRSVAKFAGHDGTPAKVHRPHPL